MRRWVCGPLLAVLTVGLVGCSATGPRFSEMAQSMPSLGEDQARIYFYRNSIMGAAVQPDVTVNGQVVGKSQPNSFFFIDRPPGTYRASARTEAESTIDITLRPKQTAYIQMSINMGLLVGRPAFERVSEVEGRKELPSLAYGGPLPVKGSTTSAQASAAPPVPAAPVVKAALPATSTPQAPAAPASAPPASTASATRPTPATSEATPFAKTSINDLRLLMQANR